MQKCMVNARFRTWQYIIQFMQLKFEELREEFYIVPYLSDVKIRFFRTFKSLKFLQQIYM